MNIIKIDEEIDLKLKKRDIECEYYIGNDIFDISKMQINVIKNTSLLLIISKEELKLDLTINVMDNVNADITIINKIKKGKFKSTIKVGSNGNAFINKLNDCENIKEALCVNLDGNYSNFNYNFKSISTEKELYDIVVNHNASYTISNIKNNLLNLSGTATIQVSTYISADLNECKADQNNKIINLTTKKCEIKPNLYIDSYDSLANHSAYIGKFNKDELFFLMSRGLSLKEANNLLIKGLLESDVNNRHMLKEIKSIIKKYWR